MKVSVQFPMHTRSENDARSLPFAVARVAKTKGVKAANGLAIAIAQRTAKQRREVRMILDSQLPRLRSQLPTADPFAERRAFKPNFYRVTLIRISAGELDTDGLAGALKAVRDEVAAWLGIDDSARAPASWRYGQQKGQQKVYAVRIEIEDDDPTTAEQIGRPSAIIVGAPIAKLGPVVGEVQHAPRGRVTCEHCGKPADVGSTCCGPNGERETVRGAAPRTVMGMLNEAFKRETQNDGRPQEQAPGGVPRVGHGLSRPGESTVAQVARGLGMTEKALRTLAPAEQARLVFRRSYYAPPGQDEDADDMTLEELTGPLFERDEPPPRIIKGGRELHRRQDFHPALGEHWIYEAAPSAARPSPREERAEARR